MVHLRAYRAAGDGKHPANNARTTKFVTTRRMLLAAVAFFVVSSSSSYAQSGPFAGMAGSW
jgi:hypothetical protein